MINSNIYSGYMYSYPHKTAYRSLDEINILDHLRSVKSADLYLHIPFCVTKCGYCNLFSITGQTEDIFSSYISAMETQIEQYNISDMQMDSITIGGGTPLILSENQLIRLFNLLPKKSGIKCPTETSIETSPNETTKEKIDILRSFNVDRVSMGIQSFIDDELTSLGRTHSAKSVYNALEILKSDDFNCLNLDLIYGIRGQTLNSLEYSIKETVKYYPNEIFIYPLYVRKGTELFGKVVGEGTYEMYLLARDMLKDAGYTQLSMRQFAKKLPSNQISKRSCGFETMISIGCGGRSYIGNIHFCTPYATKRENCLKIINEYINNESKIKMFYGYILNKSELKRRFIIKNLFYVLGMSTSEYYQVFNTDPLSDFPIFHELIKNEYAINKDERIALTPQGMSLSDYIGPMFISPEVNSKMDLWSEENRNDDKNDLL